MEVLGLKKKTLIENDISLCKNYIACDDETQSEIVLPLFDEKNNVLAVLDIDSIFKNTFDEIDKSKLEELIRLIS